MIFNPEKPFNELPFIPPQKDRYETIKVWKQESKARSALAELKGIANIIPNQSILINAIVLQEAKDSSEIENIITTQDKLYKAVSLSVKSKLDPETKEVLYYRGALFEGYNISQDKGVLTINDIIKIQTIIVKNNAGIRKLPGTALVNDKTGSTIYTPPQDLDIIKKLMRNFAEYLNNNDDSLIKLAILHHQFESIHPFYDGNGSRTGRIINILYLLLKKHLDIPILYLSSFLIKNKSDYYKLLLETTKNDVWEDWILFILKGIELTAIETIAKIKAIKTLLAETIDKVREKASKIYSKELVELLFEHPYCKNEFIIKNIGVERKAASRYLHKLEEIGILERYKIGKENIYINKELMKVLTA